MASKALERIAWKKIYGGFEKDGHWLPSWEHDKRLRTQSFRFFDLPPELRNMVYRWALMPWLSHGAYELYPLRHKLDREFTVMAIMECNQQARQEARHVFFNKIKFSIHLICREMTALDDLRAPLVQSYLPLVQRLLLQCCIFFPRSKMKRPAVLFLDLNASPAMVNLQTSKLRSDNDDNPALLEELMTRVSIIVDTLPKIGQRSVMTGDKLLEICDITDDLRHMQLGLS